MARPYWTLEGLYSKMPKTRVLRLVDLDEEGVIVTAPEPNEAYKRIAVKGVEADNLIDSYLRGHHAVPLDVVPVELVDISTAILATSLFCYSDADEIPEFYKDMHKAAISWLEHVRDNKIQLYIPQAAPVIVSVNRTREDRIFSADVLDMVR